MANCDTCDTWHREGGIGNSCFNEYCCGIVKEAGAPQFSRKKSEAKIKKLKKKLKDAKKEIKQLKKKARNA